MSLTTTPVEIVERAESAGVPGLLARHPSWPRVPVGELVRITNGAPFSSRLFNKEGHGEPLVRIRDVGVNAPTTFYSGGFEELHRVRLDDLLVGMDGDFRIARWTGPEALLNQRVCRLDILDQRLDRRWLLYSLQGYLDAIWAETSSVTVKHLSSRTIAQIPLPLPPIEEQRRIVDILEDHLSRLDAAGEGLRSALDRAAALERSAIDAVFDVRARRDGWPVLRLEELAATGPRSVTDGPFGSNLTSAHYTPAGARVVRLQNIGDGVYRPADAFISLAHYDSLRAHDVREGDVVVASLGDLVPRAAVVPDLRSPAIVKADCIRIRLRPDVDPAWVTLACRSTRSKRWAEQRMHGVGRQRLGLRGIRDIPIPFPDQAARTLAVESIGATVEALSRLRTSLGSSRDRSAILRRALLQAAFSGRLTCSGTNIDVEELAGV